MRRVTWHDTCMESTWVSAQHDTSTRPNCSHLHTLLVHKMQRSGRRGELRILLRHVGGGSVELSRESNIHTNTVSEGHHSAPGNARQWQWRATLPPERGQTRLDCAQTCWPQIVQSLSLLGVPRSN